MADNNSQNQNGTQGQKPALSWSQPSNTMQQNGGNRSPQPMPSGSPKNGGGKTSNTWWVVIGIIVVLALIAWAFVAARHASPTQDESATATSTNTSDVNTGDTMMASSTNTMGMPSTTPTPTTSMPAPTGTVPVGMSSDASQLTIPTPQTAGMSVTVANIIVTNPTWVVVYESINGKPSNALGAALFVPGRTSGSVDLLRATTAGASYLVTEAQDTDGSHTFSLKGDQPVLDQNGSSIWVSFQAN